MKKKELFQLRQSLAMVNDCKQPQKDGSLIKFKYAISKTINKVDSEIKDIQESLFNLETYKSYDEKKKSLQIEYAEKGVNDKPKIKTLPNGQQEYEMTDEKKAEFVVKFESLNDEYKDMFTDYDKLLDTDSNIELHKVKVCDVPDDVNQNALNMLVYYEMIED